MKTVRQLCTATILALLLSLTIFAGEIQVPTITNQPPQQTCATCNILAEEPQAPFLSDVVTVGEMTLTLMVSMLSAF